MPQVTLTPEERRLRKCAESARYRLRQKLGTVGPPPVTLTPEERKARKRAHKKIYYIRHPEKKKACLKKWREANKDKSRALHKAWREANPDYFKRRGGYAEIWRKIKHRESMSPVAAITRRLRRSVSGSLRGKGYKKNSSTAKIIGATFEEAWAIIESRFQPGMTIDNRTEWHIDHRIPMAAARTAAEAHALNHIDNLWPMWGADNLAKSSSFDPAERDSYFLRRGLSHAQSVV